jgi:predicted unusual protein kinase regulating ubiquinone biosynthesis (AarF/ABC1/UbiB family)
VHRSAPSLPALVGRFVVLLGLVARAGGIWLRGALARRGVGRAPAEAQAARLHDLARRFVAVAGRYKGGLIKLGQVASLRVDVLPEAVSEELARLQDRVAPHPFEEVEAQVVRTLGRPIEALYARFDREPIAAASLGQVHEAWTTDGRRVAVKVLYPGVERSVAVDLLVARIGLALFDRVTVADLREVHRQLRDSIHGEMDYVREGRAAERVAHNLRADLELARRVRVPGIDWERTGPRVLTMEFLEGVKVNDREALRARGVDPAQVATWATRAFLHMMFRDGFFHCDPHPGNLLVDGEGRVGIVDFGMHQQLEPEVLHMVRENVMATVTRDPERYARSFLDAGMIRPEDVSTVEAVARISFEPGYWNLTPSEVAQLDLGEYVSRMRAQMRRVKSFHLPDGLVMWSRAIGLLLALASELAPGTRPLEVVGPYLIGFLGAAPAGGPPRAPGSGSERADAPEP